MRARLPPWFESLDPDTADMLSKYLKSGEALDAICPRLDAMSVQMCSPLDQRFSGTMREFVDDHMYECIIVAREAMMAAFYTIVDELRCTRHHSEMAKKMEKEEEEEE